MNQYESTIQLALQELEAHPEKSLRSVARDFDISEATLRRRRAGGRNCRQSHEHEQRLSPGQEKFLVDWIIEQDELGYPPSHARTRQMATRILQMNGDSVRLGNRWISNFISRHPEVASIIGRRIEASRVDSTAQEAIQDFFIRIKAAEAHHRVLLQAIRNMDEQGLEH